MQTPASAEGQRVTAAELKAMLEAKEPIILIDVRTSEEHEEGHIPGSILLPLDMVKEASKLPEGKVILYCRSGKRSEKARLMLEEKGLKAVDLEGGILAWKASGGNVVAGPYKDLSDYPKLFDIPKGVCETLPPIMEVGK